MNKGIAEEEWKAFFMICVQALSFLMDSQLTLNFKAALQGYAVRYQYSEV